MADDKHKKEPQKYTGKLKWLDSQGFGYILADDYYLFPEVYVSPLSLSSDILKEGDCVKFNVKLSWLNSPHIAEAIDVTPFGAKCSSCKRFGHFSWKCPESEILKRKCYRCGLIGHYSNNCDQKFHGWFYNKKTHKRGSHFSRYCNDWSSLFGGGTSHSIVSVKKREDVKKVEEFEDCFILEFDPSLKDDDLGFIVCVKKAEDVKKVEETEDCFILEFDPTDELDKFSSLSLCEKSVVVADDDDDDNDDDDVLILAETGKVACRDYPHPRHLCVTHPFGKTPHDIHCKMCYCYICDIPAPCQKWNVDSMNSCLSHCYATDESPFWRNIKDREWQLNGR